MSKPKIDITRYEGELVKLAGQLKKRFELSLELDNLCSAGHEVLLELANSGEYDSARGEFWAWAYIRVMRRMLDEVGLHCEQSRDRIRSRRAKLAVEINARPTAARAPAEDAPADGFTQHWAMMYDVEVGHQLRVDAQRVPNPEDALLAAERARLDQAVIARLRAGLEKLPVRERNMLLQRYVQREPLHTVATANGISTSRACHLLKAAREQLRRAVDPSPDP